MKYIDKNNKELNDGDMIDIHQTVNGCNIFLVKTIEPLDIRYGYDFNRKYEYNKEDLFKPDFFTGEIELEVIRNIYTHNLVIFDSEKSEFDGCFLDDVLSTYEIEKIPKEYKAISFKLRVVNLDDSDLEMFDIINKI